MKTKIILLVIIATLLAGNVYPYSHDGHYLVGAIADQMLAGTPTATKIKKIIGNVSLAQAANVPDKIKDWDNVSDFTAHPVNVTANKKLNQDLQKFVVANRTRPDCTDQVLHHEYHYADIQVFDPPAYSGGQVGTNLHDIVHMIPFCIDVLTGAKSANNSQKITKRVALVLLVHYVGDLHQPLHVGAEYFDQSGHPTNPNHTTPFANDAGGNALHLVLTNLAQPTHTLHPGKLHHYWDENAVETATNRWGKIINSANPNAVTLDLMATFLKSSLPAGWNTEPTIHPATFALDCANEILPIARDAHQRLAFSGIAEKNGACMEVTNGVAIAVITGGTSDYDKFSSGIVADEIQKAGHRLADLLQVILK